MDRGLLSGYEQSLRKQLWEHRPQLVQELRIRMENEVLAGPQKRQRFLQHGGSYEEALGIPLRRIARQVVLHHIQQELIAALQGRSQSREHHGLPLDTAVASILKQPLELAGEALEQTVLVVPNSSSQRTIENHFLRLPTIGVCTNNVAICRIARQAQAPSIIHAIAHGQSGLLQVATNLHARIDIEWPAPSAAANTLPNLEQAPASWTSVPQTIPLA